MDDERMDERRKEIDRMQKAWSVHLLKLIYQARPKFCDVNIECISTGTSDSNTVAAHRGVLAATTQASEGATLTVHGSVHSSLGNEGLPSHHYGSEDVGTAHAGAPSGTIVKGGRVTFKESAHVLKRIVEFMYLGEIHELEAPGEGEDLTSEENSKLWIWLLTWSFKHKVLSLFTYILAHFVRMELTPAFAARLLELQIENSLSSSASSASVGIDGVQRPEEGRSEYMEMLDALRGYVLDWYNNTAMDDDLFLPLNKSALIVVLTECVFRSPEYHVVKAVRKWTTHSMWVEKTYASAPMPMEQVHMIMQHTDPFCLTNVQFDELCPGPPPGTHNPHIYGKYVYNKFWETMATCNKDYWNETDWCPDRKVLQEQLKKPADSTSFRLSFSNHHRVSSQPAFQQPARAAQTVHEDTGFIAPYSNFSTNSRASVLEDVDRRARVDSMHAETAFAVGPDVYFKQVERDYRYLVSLSVTTYQGLMYRGCLLPGVLRWKLDIVRQCDMFWMGVTSNSGIDTSTMIARNPQVWMISEEGTCIEHCRDNAVTAAQKVRQRMNTLFIDCFKCINNPPASWKSVVMELNSRTGDLYVELNGRARQHVFKNLPTNKHLFPCLMAVNTGQAHFELLEAIAA